MYAVEFLCTDQEFIKTLVPPHVAAGARKFWIMYEINFEKKLVRPIRHMHLRDEKNEKTTDLYGDMPWQNLHNDATSKTVMDFLAKYEKNKTGFHNSVYCFRCYGVNGPVSPLSYRRGCAQEPRRIGAELFRISKKNLSQ
jgi:hypothetical protein